MLGAFPAAGLLEFGDAGAVGCQRLGAPDSERVAADPTVYLDGAGPTDHDVADRRCAKLAAGVAASERSKQRALRDAGLLLPSSHQLDSWAAEVAHHPLALLV